MSVDHYNEIMRNSERELVHVRWVGEHGTLEEIRKLMVCPSARLILEEFPPLGAQTIDPREVDLLRTIHYRRLHTLMGGALSGQNYPAILLLDKEGCMLSPSNIMRTYCADLTPELAKWMLEHYPPDLYIAERVFIQGTVRMQFLFLEHDYAPDQARLQIDDEQVLSWLQGIEHSFQPRTVNYLLQNFLPQSAKYLLEGGYRPTPEAYVRIPSVQILKLLADYGLVPTSRNLDYAVTSNNIPLAKYLLTLDLRPSMECRSSSQYYRHVQMARLLEYYNVEPIFPREHNHQTRASYSYRQSNETENRLKPGITSADVEREMDLVLIHGVETLMQIFDNLGIKPTTEALTHGVERLVQIFHRFGINPTAQGLEQARKHGHSALLNILNEEPRTNNHISNDGYGLLWV